MPIVLKKKGKKKKPSINHRKQTFFHSTDTTKTNNTNTNTYTDSPRPSALTLNQLCEAFSGRAGRGESGRGVAGRGGAGVLHYITTAQGIMTSFSSSLRQCGVRFAQDTGISRTHGGLHTHTLLPPFFVIVMSCQRQNTHTLGLHEYTYTITTYILIFVDKYDQTCKHVFSFYSYIDINFCFVFVLLGHESLVGTKIHKVLPPP